MPTISDVSPDAIVACTDGTASPGGGGLVEITLTGSFPALESPFGVTLAGDGPSYQITGLVSLDETTLVFSLPASLAVGVYLIGAYSEADPGGVTFAIETLTVETCGGGGGGGGGGSGCGVGSLILLPDWSLLGPDSVASVSSSAGPQPPTVDVVSAYGSARPIAVGTPTDPALGTWEIEALSSGRVGAGATFLWRPQEDPEVGWIGADDGRRMCSLHPPFVYDAGVFEFSDGEAACWQASTGRVWVAVGRGSTSTIVLRWRASTDATREGWTEIDMDLADVPGAPSLPSTTRQRMALACLDDGTLILAYWYVQRLANGAAQCRSIAVIRSEDDGASWSYLAAPIENIDTNGEVFRMTVSGSWLRIDAIQGNEFISSASNDRGVSWTVPALSSLAPQTTGTTNVDRVPFGVAGLGGGRFLLAYSDPGGAVTQWTTARADGGSAWSAVTTGTPLRRTALGTTIESLGACVHGGRVYVAVATSSGTNVGQVTLAYQELDRALAGGPGAPGGDEDAPGLDYWQIVEPLDGWPRARYQPVRLVPLSTDAGIAVVAGARDVLNDAEPSDPSVIYWRLSQQTRGSFGLVAPGGRLTATSDTRTLGVLTEMGWSSVTGRPVSSWWPDTAGGSPTVGWTPERLRIATGAGDYHYYTASVFASSTDSWVQAASTLSVVLSCESGSSALTVAHAVEIESPGTSGTDKCGFYLLVTPTMVAVRSAGSLTNAAAITMDTTEPVEIRVRFGDDGAGNVEGVLWVAQIGDYLNPQAAAFTFAQIAGIVSADTVRWGALNAAAGVTLWHELGIHKGVAVDDVTREPSSMLGLPAAPYVVALDAGVGVLWGGGVVASGDAFELAPSWTWGPQLLWAPASSVQWRSVDDAEQTLIFQAATDAGPLVIEGVALFGIEAPIVEIDFADDLAFSANVTTPVELDARVFALVLDGAPNGSTIALAIAAAGREPIDGEIVGWRCRFTSGSLSGQTFAIVRYHGGVADLATIDTATGLPVAADLTGAADGDAVELFPPFGWADLGTTVVRRYMRLVFPAGTTATGDHRLGAFVAGPVLDLPIPFEWSRGESVGAPMDTAELPIGPVALRRGPTQRTLTGTIVNDYVRWREVFTRLVDTLADWSSRPFVVAIDDQRPETIVRAVLDPSGGVQLDHGFVWSQNDGDGVYRAPGGNVTLTFREVP